MEINMIILNILVGISATVYCTAVIWGIYTLRRIEKEIKEANKDEEK